VGQALFASGAGGLSGRFRSSASVDAVGGDEVADGDGDLEARLPAVAPQPAVTSPSSIPSAVKASQPSGPLPVAASVAPNQKRFAIFFPPLSLLEPPSPLTTTDGARLLQGRAPAETGTCLQVGRTKVQVVLTLEPNSDPPNVINAATCGQRSEEE